MAQDGSPSFSAPLLLSALTVGLLVSLGERIVFAVALDRRLDLSEFGVIIFTGVLTALPFLYLALQASSRVVLWALALTLTMLAVAWQLSKGIAYQKAPDGSGIDLSVAVLMLFSPFAITAIVAAAHRGIVGR